jgi:TP901 family phage tail tape measure protein
VTTRVIELILSANNSRLQTVLVASGRSVQAYEQAALRAGASSAAAGAQMQRGLAQGALAVAAAFVYLGAKTVQFDRDMRNVNSLTHLSDQAFTAMERSVLDMSRRLPQNADILAKGLYDIASSGFQGADGLTVLDASAKAASAGMSTTATAAKGITAVLNAYGLGASQAADVSDVLFQTVNVGVVTFDELAGSIGDVVGQAAAAKVSIAQIGSAVATMTLTGLSGAESVTSLNRLIEKLVKPSDALANLYKRLGYESGSSALAQKGLRAVMEDVRKETGGNIDALLELFPEIRAARGALALMANEGQNYARVARQVEDVNGRQGATLRTLHEQMRAVSNQWQVTVNKLVAGGIEAGTHVLPVLTQLLDRATDLGAGLGHVIGAGADRLAPVLHDLQQAGGDLVHIFQALAGTAGPFVAAVAGIALTGTVEGLTALGHGLADVTGFLQANQAAAAALAVVLGGRLLAAILASEAGIKFAVWYGFGRAVEVGKASVLGLGGALRGLVSPGGLAVVALGLVAGGLYQMHQEAEKNKQALADVRRQIKDTFDALGKQPSLGAFDDARAKINQLLADAVAARNQISSQRIGVQGRGGPLPKEAATVHPPKELLQSIDDLNAANRRLNEEQAHVQDNMLRMSQVTGLSTGAVQKLAEKLGVDLTGSFDSVNYAISGHLAVTGNVAAVEEQLVKAMSALADSADSAGDRVDALKNALDALLGGQLGVNEATRKYQASIDALTESVRTNGHTLDLTTEKGRAVSETLDGQVKGLEDLVVAQARNGASGRSLQRTWDSGVVALRKQMAQAGFTRTQIDAYTRSLHLIPGSVETILKAAGADAAAAEVRRLRDEINRLRNKTVSVTTVFYSFGKPVAGPPRAGGPAVATLQRHGGVWVEAYDEGGIRPVPRQATIAKDGANLIQWAEEGTGGEAFIPLGQRNRPRSEQLLATVAEMFGMRLLRFAGGGMTAAEIRDAAYKRAADLSDLRRLLTPAALQITFDLSGAVSDTLSRAEQDARNRAEYRARRTPSPYDTADDSYRAPNLRLIDYSREFSTQIGVARKWRADLARIAAVAGDDVAGQLRDMGERGVDLVHKMATGTATQMRQVAAQLRTLGPAGRDALAEFGQGLRAETRRNAQFEADLVTLIRRGRADLAARLAGMGADQGAGIARQAATASGAQLAGLGGTLAANAAATDPTLMQALTLAGLLQQAGGRLGIVGLSLRSGMSVADVYGLLVRYRDQVFGKLGATPMRQILADEQRIAAGKQPSGMAAGGIVAGAGTRSGLYYQWAEPGSGGETLIPHSPAYRARALALWHETGRIIGAGAGATRPVTIMPGAVRVDVRMTGQHQLTRADVADVSKQAVGEAMVGLARQIADQLAAG